MVYTYKEYLVYFYFYKISGVSLVVQKVSGVSPLSCSSVLPAPPYHKLSTVHLHRELKYKKLH